MSLIEDLVVKARARAKALPRRDPGRIAPSRFRGAIAGKGSLDVVAEFKRRSPSLGDIASPGVEDQLRVYVEAGAAAVSVLTEPTRFSGSYEDLEGAVRSVPVPVLMKDFVVDEAQVRHAAALGASAVLLIVRCLEPGELEELVTACREYGRTPLVECHDARELEHALTLGADDAVIGVNNRDLDTLATDRTLAPRLIREMVPEDVVVIAESGYETPEDAAEVRGLADAVLVGSALMRMTRMTRMTKNADAAAWIRAVRGAASREA